MDVRTSSPTPEEFLAHAERLRALARRLARDDASAEDLLQETWLEAQRVPSSGVARLGPWLAGVLRNLVREERRARARRQRRETLRARSEVEPATAEVVVRIEGFRELAGELRSLEEPYRTTIVRLYFDGLSAEELARELGVPSATVRSRHMRALAELRRRFDDRHGNRAAWVALLLPEFDPRDAPSQTRFFPVLAVASLAGIGVLLTLIGSGLEDPAHDGYATAAPIVREAGALSESPTRSGSDLRESVRASDTSPEWSAPIALSLVDERTQAPVPHFALVVSDATGATESLASDEGGRVRGTRMFAAGELTLRLVDHPVLLAWRERRMADRNLTWTVPWRHAEREDDARPATLALDVGPTWSLTLSGRVPDDVESIVCRLLATTGGTAPSESRAPVRRGDRGPWVRFSNEAWAVAGPAPWRLEAESGTAGARVEVDRLDGGGHLHLAFTARAALEVTLIDSEGAPIDGSLELRGPSSRAAWTKFEPGRFRAVGLEPGMHTLLGREFAHGDARVALELDAGMEHAIRLELPRLAPSGAIAGRLRIDGRALTRAVVEIVPHRAPELARRIEFGDGTEPRTDFTFATESLPEGEYTVRPHAAGVHRWKPGSIIARPGRTDLEFVADGTSPATDLVLRAFDAETGAPLAHFRARVDVDPGSPDARPGQVRTTRKSSILWADVPSDAKLAWTISAEGYVTAEGDESALVVEGDHQVVRARLYGVR